jgi:hypothetical protein
MARGASVAERRGEATAGDGEADFLMLIAAAIRGTEIGLKTIGQNEDGTFSIVVVEGETGTGVIFTHRSPVTVANRFVEYAKTRKVPIQ